MGKRIISQRRGKGSIYEAPSHRYKTDAKHPRSPQRLMGEVRELVKDPARVAPVARIRLEDGSESLVLAAEGIAEGEEIEYRSTTPETGNFVRLGDAPEGTPVFNIEIQPGDGGKLVRAAGTNAVVVGRTGGGETVVRLPSGEFKPLPNEAMAQVGMVAGGGATEKPLAKAGKKIHANRSKAKHYPVTRGVAKNPVDHPHGGGQKQHVGRGNPGRNAPPGRKVGSIAAKRTGRK